MSLAIFSAVLFSGAVGVAGCDCFALPHWQLMPHWQAESLLLLALLQQKCPDPASRREQQHRPSRTFSSEQQQPWDCLALQQLVPPVQPHDVAGRPCAGTVMAASQIKVRAVMPLVVHMSSNPLLAAQVRAE
jgi:hypothetical protein